MHLRKIVLLLSIKFIFMMVSVSGQQKPVIFYAIVSLVAFTNILVSTSQKKKFCFQILMALYIIDGIFTMGNVLHVHVFIKSPFLYARYFNIL